MVFFLNENRFKALQMYILPFFLKNLMKDFKEVPINTMIPNYRDFPLGKKVRY